MTYITSNKKLTNQLRIIFLMIALSLILNRSFASYTSGPTQPEYLSFEPVDATDMVNISTGDFVYVLPLLNVPSPEGGYPISLSYHAGIKSLQEASWVGLGWTLNPGVINRQINGFPDDYNGNINHDHLYWEGGTYRSWTFMVNLPFTFLLGDLISAGFGVGLSISNDTYQGRNGEAIFLVYAGIGIKDSPFGVGASIGLGVGSSGANMFGGIGLGMGYGIQGDILGSIGLGASIGFATDFRGNTNGFAGLNLSLSSNSKQIGNSNVYASASQSLFSTGVSFGSNGVKYTGSVAGVSHDFSNNKIGDISTNTWTSSVSIFGIFNISQAYIRYWLDVDDQTKQYGTLYAKNSSSNMTPVALDGNGFPISTNYTNNNGPTDRSFDSYSLLSAGISSEDIIEHSDPDWLVGGSFPSYDIYSVQAQGLMGVMKPHIFENGSLFRKRTINSSDPNNFPVTNFATQHNFTKNVNFRFSNDFSNSLHADPNLNVTIENLSNLTGLDWNNHKSINNDGWNASTQHLAGSKHIQWFTNEEIKNNTAKTKGFIKDDEYNYDRNVNEKTFCLNPPSTISPCQEVTTGSNVQQQIGGFSITNETGVTYHYSIPVYNVYEEQKSIKSTKNGDFERTIKNSQPYAYEWLLTAITGPDYVDRNDNGIVDNEDWGYWVKLKHGRWLNNFMWRTPFEGFMEDIGAKTTYYSKGEKEIYYLDYIRTRTNTAIFVKSPRNDGKEHLPEGITPQCIIQVQQPYSFPVCGKWDVNVPRALLKLDKIILCNNSEIDPVININNIRSHNTGPFEYAFGNSKHLVNNIIDQNDINLLSNQFAGNIIPSLKSIKFNVDYHLTPHTLNSFSNDFYGGITLNNIPPNYGFYTESPPPTINSSIPQEKQGKLSLLSIATLGKNETPILPLTTFIYDIEPHSKNINITSSNGVISASVSANDATYFKTGDILKINANYFLLVTNKLLPTSTSFTVDVLYGSLSTGSKTCTKTKNPPFLLNNYDVWGYFKSDFKNDLPEGFIKRVRTTISKEGVDSWTLKKISFPSGSTMSIKQTSDTYSKDEMELKKQIVIAIKKYIPSSTFEAPYILFIPNYTREYYVHVNKAYSYCFKQGDIINIISSPLEALNWGVVREGLCEILSIGNAQNSDPSLIALRVRVIDDDWNKNPIFNGNFNFNTGLANHPLVSAVIELLDESDFESYGGGLKTDSIKLSYDDNVLNTIYNYKYNNKSTGHLTFYPGKTLELYHPDIPNSYIKTAYQSRVYKGLSGLLAIARELPSVDIMYRMIEVTSSYNNMPINGKRKYTFQTFDKSMIKQIVNDTHNNSKPSNINDYHTSTTKIINKTSQIGNILSIEYFDNDGRLIHGTYNNYTSNANKINYSNQGVVHECYNEYRLKQPSINERFLKKLLSIREIHPSILESTKTVSQGKTNNTYYQSYDFYSGQPKEIVYENSKGEKYISILKPAYLEYPQMGLKVNTNSNKNMIAQLFSSSIYKAIYDSNTKMYIPSNNPLDIIVTTWRNDYWYRMYNSSTNNFEWQLNATSDNVWRKDKEYIYKENLNQDGTFQNFTPFNKNNLSTYNQNLVGWLLVNQYSLFDMYSKILEIRDRKGIANSSKFGYDNSRILASARNTAYEEFAVTGVEAYDLKDFGGNVKYFGSEVRLYGPLRYKTSNPNDVYTGESSVRCAPDNVALVYRMQLNQRGYTSKPNTYKLSAWVKGNGQLYYKKYATSANPATITPTYISSNNDVLLTIGDWKLISIDVQVDQSDITNGFIIEVGAGRKNSNNNFLYNPNPTISGLVFFDDFRFHPISSPTVGYVYNMSGEVAFILDESNLYTRFEYDASGNVKEIYKQTLQGEKKVSENDIKYKLPLANP